MKLKSLNLITIIALLLFCITGAHGEDSGYLNRVTFPGQGKLTGPVFVGDDVFTARDGDGIYRFSKDLDKKGHINLNANFASLAGLEGKLYVLADQDGKRSLYIYDGKTLEELKKVPAGGYDSFVEMRDYEWAKSLIIVGKNKFAYLEKDGDVGEEMVFKEKIKRVNHIAWFIKGGDESNKLLVQTEPEMGSNTGSQSTTYINIYENNKQIKRWKLEEKILCICGEYQFDNIRHIFTIDKKHKSKINIYSIFGEYSRSIMIPNDYSIIGDLAEGYDLDIIIDVRNNKNGEHYLAKVCKSFGNFLWKYPLTGRTNASGLDILFPAGDYTFEIYRGGLETGQGGRKERSTKEWKELASKESKFQLKPPWGNIDFPPNFIFVIRDIKGNHYVLDKIDPENGKREKNALIGKLNNPKITSHKVNFYQCFDQKSPEIKKFNDRLYLINQPLDKYGDFASITVFNPDLVQSQKKAAVTPYEKLIHSYSLLTNASNRQPDFKKYMGEKFGPQPVKMSRERIREVSEYYDRARRQDPFNPFLDMYFILARLELGSDINALWDEVTLIEKKCNYDIFQLSLLGALFSRYRQDKAGDYLLARAVEFAPASAPDYRRAFALAACSPGANIMGILRRMAGDREPDYDRMIGILGYMSDMAPSNQYNYYAWSAFSRRLREEGKNEQASLAADKARYYFNHNRYFSAKDSALFDILSVLAVILGILFLALSFRFTYQANRRKSHYLAEVTGISRLDGIIDLYQRYLVPGEKNLLGFFLSLGMASILADAVLLVLMKITRESLAGYYVVLLGISILTGLVAFVYLGVFLRRIEKRHYGNASVTGDRSWKNILNNSFLPFMGEQEKVILIILSLAGVIIAYILLGIQGNVTFMQEAPPAIAGGCYGCDESLRVLEEEIKKDPKNPDTKLLLGYEYLLRGYDDKAGENFRSFLVHKPGDLSARGNMALTRAGRNPEEAISGLEKIARNRDIKKFYRYADRVYYDLVLLEKEYISKDAVSPYKEELDRTNSAVVAANKIVHPGEYLPFPPAWSQEKAGLPYRQDLGKVIYSYFFPFVTAAQVSGISGDSYLYSGIAVNMAAVIYWGWTLLLLLSLFVVKEPRFIPYHCLRCGKLICERCAPVDPRGWCPQCSKIAGFHMPGAFQFILPGLRQILIGESFRGILLMTSFLYGLVYCFLLYFPFREGFLLQAGGNRYLGFMQAMTAPDVVFPYRVTEDPVLMPFVGAVLVAVLVSFISNFLEVLKSGRYVDIIQIAGIEDVETQLLEYKTVRTSLLANANSYHTRLITRQLERKTRIQDLQRKIEEPGDSGQL